MTPPSTGAEKAPPGFSLIELCVVLAVVGILAAASVVSYTGMVRKARMTQARTALKHLQKTEAIYFTEHDEYSDNTILLDFNPIRYNYYDISVVLDNDALFFTGFARGVGAMEGDLWTITPEGDPVRSP